MPRKKPEPDHSNSSLTFTIETFVDPENGEPTKAALIAFREEDYVEACT
jgi:hypothetical protein